MSDRREGYVRAYVYGWGKRRLKERRINRARAKVAARREIREQQR